MATGIRRIADQYKWISRGYGQCIVVGTSENPMNLRKDDQSCIDIYTTNSRTTGTNRSLRINQAQTAYQNAGYNRVLDVVLDSSYGTGGDGAVIRAQCDYTGGGFAHGIMNVLTSEIKLPASSLTRGSCYALELRVNVPTGGSWNSAGPIGFMRIRSAGTGVTEIDDHAYFMIFKGHTAGADSFVSATSQTVKCSFSGDIPDTTVRYLLFSQYQDTLSIGLTGSKKTTVTSVPEIAVWSTSAVAAGTQDVVKIDHTQTAISTAYIKGLRSTITVADVRAGNSVRAIYGKLDFSTSGEALGIGICIGAELVMPTNTVGAGHYACYGAQLSGTAGAFPDGGGSRTSIMRIGLSGTAATRFDDTGYLFSFNGHTAAAGDFISLTSQTVKCDVGGSKRYIVMSQMEDGLGLGATGAHMVLAAAGTRAIDVYTDYSGTGPSWAVNFDATMGTDGCTGGIMTSCITFDAIRPGAYSMNEFIKADYAAVTTTAGFGAGNVAMFELIQPTQAMGGGEVHVLSLEWTGAADNVLHGNAAFPCSFIQFQTYGTAAGDVDDHGYLFSLSGFTAGDKLLVDNSNTNIDFIADVVIKINIGGTEYWLGACDNEAGTA